LPSAKPANDPTTRLSTVTDPATMMLFTRPRRKPVFWNTARKFCSVGFSGQYVAGVRMSSAWVLSAEMSAQ
jgi:hypothetical protein